MRLLEHHTAPANLGTRSFRFEHVLADVQRAIGARVDRVRSILPGRPSLRGLTSGKLLRSRLVARLAQQELPGFEHDVAVAACAATELAHSASLCHDDIIDEADRRRGLPTMWRRLGTPGAILVGDLLLVESFGAIAEAAIGDAARDFSETLVWVCKAEMDQELAHRGHEGDADRWQDVCEGKTGALFAFPARWACPRDARLASALALAALRVGTAYQVFDDLVDELGDEAAVGKTLGCDARRGKHTIPAAGDERRRVAEATIERLLDEAIEAVRPWPAARVALETFIREDLRPCFAAMLGAAEGKA